MLKKLLKYDFKATLKYFIPFSIALILYAILTTFFSDFTKLNSSEDTNTFKSIAFIIFTIFFIILSIAYYLITNFIPIIHFFRSMVTDQGYLTHTIPVKKIKIIMSQLITALIISIISFMVIALAASIYFDLPSLIAKNPHEIKTLYEGLYELFNIPSTILGIICVILSPISNISMLFLSIALGQLVNKHKVLGSILFYFAISFVYQILSFVLSVIFSYSDSYLSDKITTDGPMFMSLLFIIGIFSNLILTAIQIFFTHYIFNKKLNLE